MQAKLGLLSAGLLAGALTAATAQTIPCTAVATEVRDRVRAAGACTDAGNERPQRAESKAGPRGAAVNRAKTSARRSSSVQPKPPSSAARTETVSVPAVVGATIESAQAQLQGFEIERFDRPSAATAGEVIQQIPDSSAAVAPGSRIALVVSSGPPTVQVPNVVERTFDEASAALSAFTVVRTEVPGAAASGRVIGQEPAAGSAVQPGSRVALQVSDGSLAGAPVAIPAVAPAPASEADQFSVIFQRNVLLAIAASLLLGVALGALLMRQWLSRDQPIAAEAAGSADERAVTIPSDAAADSAPVVRFFARLDTGEIAVEFPRVVDDEAPVTEHASDR